MCRTKWRAVSVSPCPAGLTAALALVRQGVPVCIIDRTAGPTVGLCSAGHIHLLFYGPGGLIDSSPAWSAFECTQSDTHTPHTHSHAPHLNGVIGAVVQVVWFVADQLGYFGIHRHTHPHTLQ